ncbi:hypothetical protein QBC47DRAFT_406185 [Echria macrotheca]|uniref:Clr5 domain-containing protein n=1 Tax=Echria macrotheca TaxID=438768 RepID=A0AAJ0F2T1_9PEZI|nr:hypothetical protein QBC47DRAFT_406185 [Echria macrotheca]
MSTRKRKAPTLRASDWEPMKERITELWTGDGKCTIASLEETLMLEFGFTATGRQISLQIKKWGLEKNTKPDESLFMAQRQKYRRLNEPGKRDLRFRVRGKEHPAEDLARWETRLATNQDLAQGKNAPKWEEMRTILQRNPSEPPETPAGVSYYTASPSSAALSPNDDQTRVSTSSVVHSPSPSVHSWPIGHPGTPNPGRATSLAPSTVSTPRLLEETNFEGHSPAPWNDEVQDAIVMIARSDPFLQSYTATDSASLILKSTRHQEILTRELFELQQTLGVTHPATVDKTIRLLDLLMKGNKFKAAEELATDTFLPLRAAGNKEAVCQILSRLCRIYMWRGDLERAEKVARKAVDMAPPSMFGFALRLKFTLARICYHSGSVKGYERAEANISQLLNLETGEALYESMQAWAQEPMAMMATICSDTARPYEADVWISRTLRSIDANDSTGRLSPASFALLEYAKTMVQRWRWREAEEIICPNLARCVAEYGQEHIVTSTWMVFRGNIFACRGAWGEAVTCYLASISAVEKILGPRSPSLEVRSFNLYRVYSEDQAWDKASGVVFKYRHLFNGDLSPVPFMEAEILDADGSHLEAYNTAWGHFMVVRALAPHPRRIWEYNIMGRILRNVGRQKESLELGTHTLAMANTLHGHLHPRAIECKDNLARTYMASGNNLRAIQLMEECVGEFTAHAEVGPDHYLTRRSKEALTEWRGSENVTIPFIQELDVAMGDVDMFNSVPNFGQSAQIELW